MKTHRSLNLADLMEADACLEGTVRACLSLRHLRVVKVPDRRFWQIAGRINAGRASQEQLIEFREMATGVEIMLDPEKLASAKDKNGIGMAYLVYWAWKCLESENRELLWEEQVEVLTPYRDTNLTNLKRERDGLRGDCCDSCRELTERTDEQLAVQAQENVMAGLSYMEGELRLAVFELLAEQEEWEEG